MYKIKDLKFKNRWVNMQDLTIVKFLNSEALVADKYIDIFKNNSEYIITQLSVDEPIKPPEDTFNRMKALEKDDFPKITKKGKKRFE